MNPNQHPTRWTERETTSTLVWIAAAVGISVLVAERVRSRRTRATYFACNENGTYSIRSKPRKNTVGPSSSNGRTERMTEPPIHRDPQLHLCVSIPPEAFEAAEDEVWIAVRLYARRKTGEDTFRLIGTLASRVDPDPYEVTWFFHDRDLTLDHEDYEVWSRLWDGEPDRTGDGLDFVDSDERTSEPVKTSVKPWDDSPCSFSSRSDTDFPLWNPLDTEFWDVDNYALWIYVGILVVVLGAVGLVIFAIVSSSFSK